MTNRPTNTHCKSKQILPILLILILGLSSCQVPIYISEPRPPEIQLAPDTIVMLVQNYFDYNNSPNIKDKHEQVYKQSIETFTQTLQEYLSGEAYFSVITGNLNAFNAARDSNNYLLPDSVAKLCQYYHANILCAIERVSITFDTEVIREENEDGSVSKEKEFYLRYTPRINLYSEDGIFLKQVNHTTETFYTSRSTLSGLITIEPDIKKEKAVKAVLELAESSAKTFGDKFFDSKEAVQYFIHYNSKLKTAINYMNAQDWQAAVEYLLPLANSSDPKVAKKAAYNLHVAYLGIGDKKNADLWLQKSE